VPLLFLFFFRYLCVADDACQGARGALLLTPTDSTNSTNSGVSPPSVPSEELVGGEELVEVQVTSFLTNFSIDGEYSFDTL
jgi:hypothetical protein